MLSTLSGCKRRSSFCRSSHRGGYRSHQNLVLENDVQWKSHWDAEEQLYFSGNEFLCLGTTLFRFYNQLFNKNKVVDSELSSYAQNRIFRARYSCGLAEFTFLPAFSHQE